MRIWAHDHMYDHLIICSYDQWSYDRIVRSYDHAIIWSHDLQTKSSGNWKSLSPPCSGRKKASNVVFTRTLVIFTPCEIYSKFLSNETQPCYRLIVTLPLFQTGTSNRDMYSHSLVRILVFTSSGVFTQALLRQPNLRRVPPLVELLLTHVHPVTLSLKPWFGHV